MISQSYGVIPFIKIGEEYRFLILQQATLTRSFPKGGIENGETPLQCALREFEEEIGIKTIEIYEDKKFETRYNISLNGIIGEKSVVYFLGKLPETFENEIRLEKPQKLNRKLCNQEELLQLNNMPNRKFSEYINLVKKIGICVENI